MESRRSSERRKSFCSPLWPCGGHLSRGGCHGNVSRSTFYRHREEAGASAINRKRSRSPCDRSVKESRNCTNRERAASDNCALPPGSSTDGYVEETLPSSVSTEVYNSTDDRGEDNALCYFSAATETEDERSEADSIGNVEGLREDGSSTSENNEQHHEFAEFPQCLRWLDWRIKTGSTEKAMHLAMELAGQQTSSCRIKKILEGAGIRKLSLESCFLGHLARKNELDPRQLCSERGCVGDGKHGRKFQYFCLEDIARAWHKSKKMCSLLKYRHDETTRMRKEIPQGERNEGANQNRCDLIADCIDGACYKELDLEFRFDQYDLCFQLSFDGYEAHKSTTCNAWCIMLINLNLPPSVRFKNENMIPFGITPGPEAPKALEPFLDPLFKVFEKFKTPQSMQLWDERLVNVRMFLIFVTADTPAINKVMHSRGHNAAHPCRFCNVAGA